MKLSLDECQSITDNELEIISKSLEFFPLLQEIHLNFNRCEKITDEGVMKLSQSLQKLGSLNVFEINFNACKQVTGRGVLELGHILSSLTSLRKLSIESEQCEETGLVEIGQSFKTLCVLEKFQLLSNQWKISEEGWKRFGEDLKCLTSLKSLFLAFKSSEYVTDQTLTILSQSLNHLARLQSLSLEINSCDKVTKVGVAALIEQIGHSKSLEEVYIKVRCEHFTQDEKMMLSKKLQSIPKNFYLF